MAIWKTSSDAYCDETSKWEPASRVVKFKTAGVKSRYLYDLKGDIGFCYVPREDFVVVMTFNIKKGSHLGTFYLSDKNVTVESIRQILFNDVEKQDEVTEKYKFKGILKHTFLSKVTWDKYFTSNEDVSRDKKFDHQMVSLCNILSKISKVSIISGSFPHSVDRKVDQTIMGRREQICFFPEKLVFPIYEVYGVWHNYCPETELLRGVGDKNRFDFMVEPTHITYNKFNSAQQILNCPM